VPAGIIGARIYHVATDFDRYRDDLASAVEIWSGGLGIWGAISGGALGAILACRRHGYPVGLLADAIAPALLVAQAIGRVGNYFNQELFGRPTDLPWALEIDAEHRPDGFLEFETFHPTFLYEALWNLALAALIVVVGGRLTRGSARGAQFALYVMGYTVGRLMIELVRIDPATELFGQRINVWTSIVVFLGAAVAFVLLRRRGAADPEPTASSASDELVDVDEALDVDEAVDADPTGDESGSSQPIA
jgi:prolipoprotein diacylglyceryl transferase